jgi:hypothetical protein
MRSNDFGKKPDNTKIQITRGGDCFEVYVPPIEFHPVILFFAQFVMLWLSFISIWISMAVQASSPVNISLLMCGLPIGAAICLLIYLFLFVLFCETYFRIDRHEISLVKTMFGFEIIRKHSEPKREITKLIFTHATRKNNRAIAAALKIEIGTKSIILGGSGGGIQHEAEVTWLASEVSEWLDKPLKIY